MGDSTTNQKSFTNPDLEVNQGVLESLDLFLFGVHFLGAILRFRDLFGDV